MSLKDVLQADLKTAMLARDSLTTDVIKGLKSAVLYAEVASGKREQGLEDSEILAVLQKESKKRQESADLYSKGDRAELAQKELAEKAIIDKYLPAQLSEAELVQLINDCLADMGLKNPAKQDMGKIIGAVKAKVGSSADGSVLAKLVNQRINS